MPTLEVIENFCALKDNANWSNAYIDSKNKITKKNMSVYINHLKNCEEHLTTGLLAKRQYITGKEWKNPISARINIHILEKQPEVDTLQKNIKEKINTLYPKTKQIREYIINNDRVVLDTTKKSKKYTLLNKLAIMIKKFI